MVGSHIIYSGTTLAFTYVLLSMITSELLQSLKFGIAS